MQVKIEKIGDGFGLILPKEVIEACGFSSEATVTVEDKTLVVSAAPPGKPRPKSSSSFSSFVLGRRAFEDEDEQMRAACDDSGRY